MDNDSLVPVAYYTQYKDQADELDELTGRSIAMEKSLKIVGVFDASASGLERMLSEGIENKLIPVDNWAVLGEKNGIPGAISFWPADMVAKTLISVYDARERKKQDIDEITGISDIRRGQTDPDETMGAQKIKSNYSNLRLKEQQADMARFCKQVVKNTAVIIAEHFSIDTIKKISGVQLFDTAQDKQAMQMQIQQAQQHFQQAMQMFQESKQPKPPGTPAAPPMQPPQPPPDVPLSMQDMLQNPTWQDVEQLLRNEPALCFKIDIEIDSTILADEEKDRADRIEFLSAVGSFLEKATALPPQLAPKLLPMLGQMLLFGVRGFKVGKELEGQLRLTIKQLEKLANQPQQPPPNPAMIKAQADIQDQQARSQADRADAQQEAQLKAQEQQFEFNLKTKEQQQNYAIDVAEMKLKAQLDMQNQAMEMAKPVVR
jgi:hypothetical protein